MLHYSLSRKELLFYLSLPNFPAWWIQFWLQFIPHLTCLFWIFYSKEWFIFMIFSSLINMSLFARQFSLLVLCFQFSTSICKIWSSVRNSLTSFLSQICDTVQQWILHFKYNIFEVIFCLINLTEAHKWSGEEGWLRVREGKGEGKKKEIAMNKVWRSVA